MQEILVKTHLIITDVHEEYHMDWCGKLMDAKPQLQDGKPIFIIVGGAGRIELNTIDIAYIEKIAKRMTAPHGREAVTTDKARIYILEESGNNKLMGILTHNHVKKYAPMYDRVGYRY